MILKPKYYAPVFAGLLSGGLLIGAWISEYVFGYLPCTMCYWQRHVHITVVIIALIAIFCTRLEMPLRKGFTLLLILLLLGSAGLAFYHSGVEFKWWEGPKTCASGNVALPDFSGDNPFAQLDSKIKPPACNEAVWFFLGLSMATWNGILSLGSAILTAILGRGQYAKH
jgi:disulfide bond formation protein DsbB